MNVSKKVLFAVAFLAMLSGSVVTYAIVQMTYTVPSRAEIRGINLQLYWFVSDTEAPTTKVVSHDFAVIERGTVAYTPYIILKNAGSKPMSLEFDTTLSTSFGYVYWEIEVYYAPALEPARWQWRNWNEAITQSSAIIPGSPTNPVPAFTTLGQRPASPDGNALGRIRIALSISATSPIQIVTFDITATATEL